MFQNNITTISKSYYQTGTTFGDVYKDITLLGLNIDSLENNNASILVKYKSEIYESDENGNKGELLPSTTNISSIAYGEQKAVNSTIVNASTGQIIGEFESRNNNKVRNIQTKEVIHGSSVNKNEKTYTYISGTEVVSGETVNTYTTINVEGEANFLANAILSDSLGITQAIHNAFDLLIVSGRV